MGRSVARGATSKAQQIAEAEQVYSMLRTGARPAAVMQALGISKATMYRRLEYARKLNLDPLVDERREDQLARINDLRQIALRTLSRTVQVLTPAGMVEEPACDPTQVAALLGRLTSLDELEAKLTGTLVPTKVDHSVTVNDAFATLMDELNSRPPVDRPVPRV